jgi:hypothetical protein
MTSPAPGFVIMIRYEATMYAYDIGAPLLTYYNLQTF